MGSQRAHIVLPQELVEEIDLLVGSQGRSAFLVETARAELRRRRLINVLNSPDPIWIEHDHPEFAQGSSSWVRSLRREGETRAGSAEASSRAVD